MGFPSKGKDDKKRKAVDGTLYRQNDRCPPDQLELHPSLRSKMKFVNKGCPAKIME